MKKPRKEKKPLKTEHQPRKVRLPGFILKEELGTGDLIKRATSAFGIRHCKGCEGRTTKLNRMLVFTSRSRNH